MNEQENVRITQNAYDAFKRGDIPGLLNLMTDDVGWFLPGPKEIVPFVGKRQGRAAVGEFFAKVAEMQDVEQFEPREFIAQGNTVVGLGHYKWRVKSTGRRFESDFAHVFTLQNGKISNFQEFFDSYAGVSAYSTTQAAAR